MNFKKNKETNLDSKKKKESKLESKNKSTQGQKKNNFKNSFQGNKSVQTQKKETKKPATDTGKTSITGDWFYMNAKETPLRCLYDVLKEQSKDIELWETAGVMEINLSPKTTLDFEEMKPYFRDEEGAAFLTKHQVQSMYMVSFSSEDYEKVLPFFETIIAECDGFFCADTANFYPRFPKL